MIIVVALALCTFVALLTAIRASVWVLVAAGVGLLGLWAAQLQSAEGAVAFLADGVTVDHALALAVTTLLFVIVTTLFDDARYADAIARARYATMAPSVLVVLGTVSILAVVAIDLVTVRASLVEAAYNYVFPVFWVALGTALLLREPSYGLETRAEKAAVGAFDGASPGTTPDMQPAS